ncbi:hypothetical protein E3U43_006393 [Larimichthys crocea]|uniref:Uncharacterized protein n=1 Tax=Larimichthys crocea TaxID=215358 RepID=A0ACD3RKK9_LARCR|nr:hypothetical protein E3U43_006393 [Larimichthys crocea]
MSSPESDSKAEAEDEDDLLYLMIYDMKTYEKELKETVESPQSGRERPRPEPLIIDAESDDSEDETTQAQRQKDQEGPEGAHLAMKKRRLVLHLPSQAANPHSLPVNQIEIQEDFLA